MATKNVPEKETPKTRGLKTFVFKAGFEGKPDKPIKVTAYIFDRQGSLLATRPASDGSFQVDLKPELARTARIFLGPEQPAELRKQEVTLDRMDSLHAYEAIWKFDPKELGYQLMPIPEFLWQWWLWCSCRVRGQVVKPVSVAGVITDLPVCNARVHICEVDPIWWIIPRLPDPIIVRLRDELLYEIEHPRPIPLPDPPPFVIDPGVIDPSPIAIADANRRELPVSEATVLAATKLAEIPMSRTAKLLSAPAPAEARSGMAAMQMSTASAAASLKSPAALDMATHSALSSPSASVVRQALLDNVALIRPYLCIWYWLWPYLCRCDEIKVVTTDAQGRFDTNIWYLCAGDYPDLYFWVEYSIGGAWTSVYHPNPVCCYTSWDYACGSEVTLHVTDPRVVPCGNPPPDLPGKVVAVLSIGQNVSMSEIPVDSTGAAPLSGTATEGLENGASPFGGVLEPRVWFSRSALFAMGITHYRWSYRQITAGDASTPVSDVWHALERDVVRHYSVYDPITDTLSFPADPMGPDAAYPGMHLFRIQPINAPTGRPEDWAPIDAHEDLASGFFESYLAHGGDAALGAGKYELKLELFDTSGGSPSAVNFTARGIGLKVANVPAPFGAGTVTTVDADDHHRFKNGSGETVAFRLVLHVDNNVCSSELFPISGMGLTVDADCGFIQYLPATSAHISFLASHPHGFATLSFSTIRGTSTDVPPADAAGQVNAAALNGFVRSGSIFGKDVPVATLLTVNTPMGHTPCTKAAFSEMLYVQAMATDGWQLLSYLNPAPNPKHSAYALEPA